MVPLFGHSPGHLGLLARAEDGTRVLCAGDAVFSLAQLRRGEIAGICEEPRDARATLRALDGLLGAHRTFLLPAHEREALDRLAAGTPSSETVALLGESVVQSKVTNGPAARGPSS